MYNIIKVSILMNTCYLAEMAENCCLKMEF